jgi:tetratricopeptide (TPR) repeat protein
MREFTLRYSLIPLCGTILCALAASGLNAQERLFGDSAVAERYVIWAEAKLAAGSPAEALAGLERGADYAPVSADLLYLLAYTRKIQGAPAATVLAACVSALENGRWSRYSTAACRLLEAEILIQLRDYGRALLLLEQADEVRSPVPSSSAEPGGRGVQETYPGAFGLSAESALLRLRALRGLERYDEFIRFMEEFMERFPRDSRFLRLLFGCMEDRGPLPALKPLAASALKRLPFLVEDDPDLAYIASPFIADREEAARYVAAYRAAGDPNPASLPQALFLGLVGDEQAVNELFGRKAGPAAGRFSAEDPALGGFRGVRGGVEASCFPAASAACFKGAHEVRGFREGSFREPLLDAFYDLQWGGRVGQYRRAHLHGRGARHHELQGVLGGHDPAQAHHGDFHGFGGEMDLP